MTPKAKQQSYELLCSVYLDIPNPYQAYLFATINMNQKTVDKSLAYDLYGYNLDDENPESWSSEKLAVFISRKLNFDKDSIFYNHIIVAAENDAVLFEISPKNQNWCISTASIVNGILSLITSNPKKDRDTLQFKNIQDRKRSNLPKDKTPLRKYFLECNDKLIHTIVNNFFLAAYSELFKKESYLFKTVGIQALFRVLKEILIKNLDTDKDISVIYFSSILKLCADIDFSDNFYTASGLGKTRITNSMLIKLGFKNIEAINNESDIANYKRLLYLQ